MLMCFGHVYEHRVVYGHIGTSDSHVLTEELFTDDVEPPSDQVSTHSRLFYFSLVFWCV